MYLIMIYIYTYIYIYIIIIYVYIYIYIPGEDGRWRSPVEIAKQFLREFRMDRGSNKSITQSITRQT